MSTPFFYPAMLSAQSNCKINLLLNVFRRREDGFHELETVMQPVGLFDDLDIERTEMPGVRLSCSHPEIPLGPENLICRAASLFQAEAGVADGLEIHLRKHLPVAAGIGGGSGNAATTLRSLNQLYDDALSEDQLINLAAQLGSDVPFFFDPGPGIATGRGEIVESVPDFPLFRDAGVLLVNPGFGVSTPWAYKNFRVNEPGATCSNSLSHFVGALRAGDWEAVASGLFNSLEQPVFQKFPVLKLIRSELLAAGAEGALLSGSGATVFGLVRHLAEGETIRERFLASYGRDCWSQVVPLGREDTHRG